MEAQAERRLIRLVGIAVWLVYALHIVPGGGVNPNRYFNLTHAFINQGTLHIDAYHENTVDKSFFQGHYYIAALPGPSILAIPAYLVFKALYAITPREWLASLQNIRSFKAETGGGFYENIDNTEYFLSTIWITLWTLCVLSALGTVYLIRLLRVLNFSLPLSIGGGLAYAFGTGAFFFSTTYFSHCLIGAFVIFCLYQAARATQNGDLPARYVLIGVFAGMATLIEYVGAAALVLMALYVWRIGGFRALIRLAAGAFLPLLVLAAYNTLTFGVPWALSHQYMIQRTWNAQGQGLAGVAGLPTFERLWGLTLSPERGLFLYNPILLLAPAGIFFILRGKDTFKTLLIVMLLLALSNFAYNILLTDWMAGASFGPRYLVPTAACWVALAMYGLRRAPAWVWGPLLALSVFINWLGAQYGFAASVFEHVGRLFSAGPTLPALAAIINHSEGENALYALVTRYHTLFLGLYGLLILALGYLIVRSLMRVHAFSDKQAA